MKIFALLALLGSAAAFAPSTQKASSTQLGASLDGLPGNTLPIKSFDPLSLATWGSDETFAWFKASELKHCRVAMLATTGYIVQGSGIHFPGMLSKDVSFESLSAMNPFDAWSAVPFAGKAQILFTIFLCELYTEGLQGTHYMKGGDTPTILFPPVDFSGVSAETMKLKRDRELNNGRLAMIAIMGFIAANAVPGSVPVLSGVGTFP
jgi:hypothetical protein